MFINRLLGLHNSSRSNPPSILAWCLFWQACTDFFWRLLIVCHWNLKCKQIYKTAALISCFLRWASKLLLLCCGVKWKMNTAWHNPHDSKPTATARICMDEIHVNRLVRVVDCSEFHLLHEALIQMFQGVCWWGFPPQEKMWILLFILYYYKCLTVTHIFCSGNCFYHLVISTTGRSLLSNVENMNKNWVFVWGGPWF